MPQGTWISNEGTTPTRTSSILRLHRRADGAFAAQWLPAAVIAVAWLVAAPAVAQDASTVLVIEGGTLIDGNGGEPVKDTVVIIRDDRIEAVTTQGQAPYPAGATVIQADGRFILPGLIDAHLHYSGFLSELLLAHGVTTAFDISGRNLYQVVQRDAIAAGRLSGPRLYVPVDSVLAPTRPDGVAYGREGPRREVSAEMAARIAEGAIADGADYINIRRGLSVEAFTAAVDVAHAAGLAVIAQPIGPDVYAREAVLAGADILEHAAGVSYSIARNPSAWEGWGDDEGASLDVRPYADMDEAKARDLIRLMVESDVYLEPDLIAEGRGLHRQSDQWELEDFRLLSDPGLSYIAPGVRAKWLANYAELHELPAAEHAQLVEGFANYQTFIRWFADAGGKVMVGDDTSYSGWAVPGLGVHREMELLVDAGLTPMQAIMAATRNTAEGFRVQGEVGTVEPGKFADLVILDADPLADIRNTQGIVEVIQDGRVLDRSYNNSFTDAFWGDDLEAPDWYWALKRATEEDGIRTLAGLRDATSAFGQPAPGIEAIEPLVQTEGGLGFTLTIRGVNFTTRSLAYWGERPMETRLVSPTEIEVDIEAALIARAGFFPIQVRNPGPSLSQPKWGDTSNRASFIVGLAPADAS